MSKDDSFFYRYLNPKLYKLDVYNLQFENLNTYIKGHLSLEEGQKLSIVVKYNPIMVLLSIVLGKAGFFYAFC